MIYYIDCEFDAYCGPLLSIAIVREDGKSLYIIKDTKASDRWVRDNVIPVMESTPVSAFQIYAHKVIADMIEGFFADDTEIVIVADWPDDIKYFCQLVITGPGKMINIPGFQTKVVREDAYPTDLEGAVQHNAWWDAMALRYKLTGEK